MLLKQPITVIQITKKQLTYGKDLRAFDKRKAAINWPAHIQSENGCIQDGELFITPAVSQSKNFDQAKHLLLLDEIEINAEQVQAGKLPEKVSSSFILLPETKATHKWDIYAFRCNEQQLSVLFEWDYFKVGLPERSSHKLFDLETPRTINLKINGKIDSTLSVGTRRYYKEMEYTFQHHGVFSEYELQKGNVLKPTTTSPDKEISLLKQLY